MSTPLRLLIVEDSEDDALLLLEALRQGGFTPASLRVETADAMRAALEHGTWDIIIADYVLPKFSGLDALRLMQQLGLDLPFILVTGQAGEELAVDAMRAGAGDYLLKDRLAIRLVPAIERELREAQVRRERRQVEEEREQLLIERERLLNEAKQRAAELDASFNAIAEGLIIYGTAGQIVRMNDAARRIFQYSREDMAREVTERLSMLPMETAEGKPIPLDATPPARALRGETVIAEVMVFQRPPQPLWTLVSAGPIRTPDGRVLGAVATITDITPLHELQEQQEIYVHTISHDLRAPLTTIQGHAQLLREMLDDAHLNGYLLDGTDAILRSAQRMNVMIQDLVDAARLQGGKLILKRQPVDLASYLEELLKRAATAMDVNRIRLEIPAGLPPVFADYDRMERIFTNLLTNALKFSPLIDRS